MEKMPPKNEWPSLTISQLYDIKSQMTNRYFDLKRINASFADQFLTYTKQLDSLIALREGEQLASSQQTDEDA